MQWHSPPIEEAIPDTTQAHCQCVLKCSRPVQADRSLAGQGVGALPARVVLRKRVVNFEPSLFAELE